MIIIVCVLFPVVFAIDCESSALPLYIQRVHGSSADKESFQIWEGEADTGTLIIEHNGVDCDASTLTYETCVNPTLHTVVLLDG